MSLSVTCFSGLVTLKCSSPVAARVPHAVLSRLLFKCTISLKDTSIFYYKYYSSFREHTGKSYLFVSLQFRCASRWLFPSRSAASHCLVQWFSVVTSPPLQTSRMFWSPGDSSPSARTLFWSTTLPVCNQVSHFLSLFPLLIASYLLGFHECTFIAGIFCCVGIIVCHWRVMLLSCWTRWTIIYLPFGKMNVPRIFVIEFKGLFHTFKPLCFSIFRNAFANCN